MNWKLCNSKMKDKGRASYRVEASCGSILEWNSRSQEAHRNTLSRLDFSFSFFSFFCPPSLFSFFVFSLFLFSASLSKYLKSIHLSPLSLLLPYFPCRTWHSSINSILVSSFAHPLFFTNYYCIVFQKIKFDHLAFLA